MRSRVKTKIEAMNTIEIGIGAALAAFSIWAFYDSCVRAGRRQIDEMEFVDMLP